VELLTRNRTTVPAARSGDGGKVVAEHPAMLSLLTILVLLAPRGGGFSGL